METTLLAKVYDGIEVLDLALFRWMFPSSTYSSLKLVVPKSRHSVNWPIVHVMLDIRGAEVTIFQMSLWQLRIANFRSAEKHVSHSLTSFAVACLPSICPLIIGFANVTQTQSIDTCTTWVGMNFPIWSSGTTQQSSRARSGHQISSCLVSLHFLCDILRTPRESRGFAQWSFDHKTKVGFNSSCYRGGRERSN